MTFSSQKQLITLPDSPYHAAYLEAGTGPTVLFLHGFMGEGQCWRSLIHTLQPHYRCIALDMFGFGASSKPRIQYNIAKMVDFVQRFVLALSLKPVAVVGHSLGGWVAAAHALAYPDAVGGLVLVAPAGIRDDSFCGRYDHLRPLLWETPVVDVALWLAQPLAFLLGQQANLAGVRSIRRELNRQPSARSFLVDRMRPEDAIDTVEREIHQLRLPTLVIAGEHDVTIPLWHCQTYAQEIPGATLEIIPEAAHSLPQDHAVDVGALIVPFLKSRVLASDGLSSS